MKQQRSRKQRRVKIKTPGGLVKIAYRKRKPKKAHCALCNAILSSVPAERPYRIRALAKTKRRPERPYGGMLCHMCMREKIKAGVRENV